MLTLNCKGKLLSLSKPVVMGIINATPDSFYPGSRLLDIDAAFHLAKKMKDDGAHIIDVGGQSTRPGSFRLSASEEKERVIPFIRKIHEELPEIIVSVDTYHSSVAIKALENGASMVNDISAGEMDEKMIETVAAYSAPFVCMHMKGRPENMHLNTNYNHLLEDIVDFFSKKIDTCKSAGVHDILIDPGFGFGKNIEQNFELLRNLQIFKMFKMPIVAGLSRKSTIYKTLGITSNEALNGTTVLNTLALINGANILRVHDVREAVEAIRLVEAYKGPQS
ncbi:MAG: dihydropteroate synthase [Bacteroidetes bacterium]|nr:dihydropteroate synthase [Bacteroidota bacterium]